MRAVLSLLFVSVAAIGCAPAANLTPSPAQASPTPTGIVPSCVPNLDGVIEASEMQPAVGVPEHFLVTTAQRSVDLTGSAHQWDWSWSGASDAGFNLEGNTFATAWYVASFPDGQFAAPIDGAGTTDGVYKVDDQAVWLLGVASHEVDAPSGRVLLPYQSPIALYRFPLQVGKTWTSSGTVVNGLFNGLPYAGYDTYEVSVDATGTLVLPDFTFTQVLRVNTHVIVSPAVGITSTRRLSSFLFECYGEVARATSLVDESAADFTTASEIRRLGLPPAP